MVAQMKGDLFMQKLFKNKILSTALLTAGLAAAAVFAPAIAQTTQSIAPQTNVLPAFTHPQSVPQDLARIDGALNGTESFAGRFAQYGSDGSFSQGIVYLKRPGKIRFEYDPPAALLLVSDGVTLTQVDRQLDTVDRIPLGATPLSFFLSENVQLENDVDIIGLQKTISDIRVSARDGSGNVDGVITMVFDPQNLALREWVITDSLGAQTRILLSDLAYNEKLNPRLFIYRDNEGPRR